ncbi:cytochrome P450 27C1-like [Paramuricea clavata]|uniref:Cytochrome P450 27C1-like n=1 Tax=Paramuricea clavata TaxID=317549 RepID=A0A6S7JKF1_PARCT|nr:cytochrome P450 27C1-like [Paramuricea clavata]
MALLSCSFSNSLYFQRLLRLSSPLVMMARSSSTVVAKSVDGKILPFSEIPGPKGTIRNCLDYSLGKGSYFDVITKRFERFGPIYSEQILDTRVVNISDVDATMKLLHAESTFQMRPGFEAAAEVINNQNGLIGLISNDYDVWYSDRSLISPKMLRPKDINETFPMLNTVANDFILRLSHLTQSNKMNNIEEELNFWAVESFASVLFNHRLGFYNHPPDPTAVEFVHASVGMIDNIGKLCLYGSLHKYIKIPAYYRLKKNMATIHTIGMEIINKILATKRERDCSNKQSLFEYLVSNGRDTPKTMAAIIGLMAAGIDTTSTTCLWLLYTLSQHPDIQEKLYQQLVSAIGPDGEVLASNIPPFLKAALKESQRMYPVGGYVVARVFDKDVDVLGYHIPTGVNILMHEHLASLDGRYYGEDAKKFVPERWLRDETRKRHEVNSFTSLPFGFGVRMCLGRRMAESLIYTLVAKILIRYRLQYAEGFENGVNRSLVGILMKPDRPVLLKFITRE